MENLLTPAEDETHFQLPIVRKKWRKLPPDERLGIPEIFLQINKKEIKKIRNIEDPKKRLMQAARLQYELYNNIHSDLTAWIAGYLSESIIRKQFGSAKNLHRAFYPISSKQNLSWADIKRKIKVPSEITEELSEETGIHIGDGNLSILLDKEGFSRYRYTITGHLEDEYLYHKERVQILLKRLYNFHGRTIKGGKNNTIETVLTSKRVFYFKKNTLGLNDGPKYDIAVPHQIKKDKMMMKHLIIGVIDTDFTLNDSTNLVGNLTCVKTMKQISKSLEELNIQHSLNIQGHYAKIRIGKEGAETILEDWKLKNLKHTSKYQVLKEFGRYIHHSRTEERLGLLKGVLDLESLEKTCKKRKRPGQGSNLRS